LTPVPEQVDRLGPDDPRRIRVREARPPERSIEAHVALTRGGFEKLVPRMIPSKGWSFRTDLYIEAWDGKGFLLVGEAVPHVLRLKRKIDERGAHLYELSLSTARPEAAGSGSVTLSKGSSASVELPRRGGKMLFRLGQEMLSGLRLEGRAPEAAIARFDRTLRQVLRDAAFEHDSRVLANLEGRGFRFVPSHTNSKLRLLREVEGPHRLGKVKLLLGQTLDWDPSTGDERARFELESEPKKPHERGLARLVEDTLEIDRLEPADLAGDLPKTEALILKALNAQSIAERLARERA
jgi:hypothetical protein